jgi:hypothetical protein
MIVNSPSVVNEFSLLPSTTSCEATHSSSPYRTRHRRTHHGCPELLQRRDSNDDWRSSLKKASTLVASTSTQPQHVVDSPGVPYVEGIIPSPRHHHRTAIDSAGGYLIADKECTGVDYQRQWERQSDKAVSMGVCQQSCSDLPVLSEVNVAESQPDGLNRVDENLEFSSMLYDDQNDVPDADVSAMLPIQVLC